MSESPAGFSWTPPSSPDSLEYTKLFAYIDELKRTNRKLGMAWFAAACEADFWLWQWKVMSLGKLKIKDAGHKRYGRLWVMEPWFFDRMREVQSDFENPRITSVLYQFGRHMFKSSAVQKGGALWMLGKNRSETIGVMTHKAEKVGVAFGKDYLAEIRQNEVLRAHWPQFRELEEASTERITVSRPPGPREASISIHGILSSAASGHYTKWFIDDIAAPEETSPIVLAEIDSRISMLAFLGHDEQKSFWIGCPSCDLDPVEKRRLEGLKVKTKRPFFDLVRRHPGIEPGGIYPLRSKKFYEDLRAKTRDDHFSSQVELIIKPPGMVFFRTEWLRRYTGKPEQQAIGARIHIFLDPAGGKKAGKKLSDFLIVRVVAFCFDRRRRNLDLWRERVGMTEAHDLLFGPVPGEDSSQALCLQVPNLARGLVAKWKRYDPNLTVWVEEAGETQFCQSIRRELMFRRRQSPASAVSCSIRELRSHVPKENRIGNLQAHYRNGLVEYPLEGFGHGSFTTDDERDTLDQFLEDEYRQWTLQGDIANDDMLDTEAWGALPGLSIPYPEDPSSTSSSEGGFGASPLAGSGGPERPSWRVA